MKMRMATLAACASTLVVSVFVGTAPAKADGWDYVWYKGKCYAIAHPNGSNPALLSALPNPLYWGLRPNSRCKNSPIPVTNLPFAAEAPHKWHPMPIGR